MTCATISPSQLRDLWKADAGIHVIDVRTPIEYRALHAPMAKLLPLDQLDPDSLLRELKPRSDRPLYLICKSGARAAKACRKLRDCGCTDVVCVEGGTDAWVNAGLEVERGKSAISLERQVRIAAGSLVAIGTVLGVTVSPWLLILPGFVGCGLVFAGLTDWCGMGMILAKMPWNR